MEGRFSRRAYKCLGISYCLLLVLGLEPRPAKRSRSPPTKLVELRLENSGLYNYDERRSAKSTRTNIIFPKPLHVQDSLCNLDCPCISANPAAASLTSGMVPGSAFS